MIENEINNYSYIKEIFEKTSASALPFKKCNALGTYIMSINNKPICVLRETQYAFLNALTNSINPLQHALFLYNHSNLLLNKYLPIFKVAISC